MCRASDLINVIDTPGLFDLSVSADYISQEIIRCLTLAEEGIHAVLFVLSVRNRVTPEEESTLNTLQRIFESKIIDYLIVVFTGGDELEYNKQTLEDYLRGATPEFLRRSKKKLPKPRSELILEGLTTLNIAKGVE